MKIKKRLRLNTFISLSVLILILLSLAWSFREMSVATRNMDRVAEMRKVAFERIILRDDYLLNQEERARTQWYAKSETLRGLLESASKTISGSEEQALLKEARENFDATFTSFSHFLEEQKKRKSSSNKGINFTEADSRLIGQVFLKAYAVNDSINRLYESALIKRTTARDRGFLLIIMAIISGVIAIIINSTEINRIFTKRIEALGKGVEIIGSGNLAYRIGVEGDDELSGLALASNDMAAKLKESYTSVENLQNEIAQRIRAEDGLRASEKLYHNLFDNMLEGLAYCRMIFVENVPHDFIYLNVNNAFETLTGLKNVEGKRVTEVIPGIRESDQKLLEIYGRVSRTGEPERIEIFVEALKMWFSICVYSPEKEYFVAVFDVITDRKRVEEKLRASEVRFRRLFEAARDGILILDAETGMIVDVNPFLIELLGFSQEVFLGKKIWELGFFKDIIANQANFLELQQKEYLHYENLPLETSDGRQIEVEFVSHVYRVNHHKVIQCNIRDITERRIKEKEIEEKNSEMERFTYTVSHDLKSPLVTIKTFLGYLEQDMSDSNETQVGQDIGYIRTAADKMGRLLDELLEMSRVGRVVNPSVTVTFNELVEDALNAVAGSISENCVEVKVDDSAISLHGDRQRLVEIWQNLIENSVKYLGDRKSPLIEVGVERDGEETLFFVRDNGIGIDPRYKEKIFGLFEKLDPKTEGSGLGLALVKRIVALYHGAIRVESEIGKGACFRFTLPEAISRQTRGEQI